MTNKAVVFMPTKLRYRLGVAFCLMSILPLLAGIYVASLFIKFPFVVNPANLVSISLVLLISVGLSFLGYRITRQLAIPIVQAAEAAHEIAAGKLDQTTDLKGSDELEELSRSLHTISQNAKELLNRVEKLSLKDKLTGLYNAAYIRERLSEEIFRAVHYQQACSFVYFLVDDFDGYAARCGEAASLEALKSVAGIFNRYLAEFDRAARITKNEFVMILPDKNKKKAIELARHIQREVASFPFAKGQGRGYDRLTVSVGISENPIDGVSADDLYRKAYERVKAATRKGNNLMETSG